MILNIVLYLAIFLTLFFILLASISPSYKYPLLAFILIIPVVDATWNYKYAGINFIYIVNVAFILIFLIRLLIKKEKIYKFPYIKLFVIYFHILIIIFIHTSINSGIIWSLETFVKSLFMPFSFYLCYSYFDDYRGGKALATVFILAGVFPLIFTLVQEFTGHIWFYRSSRGLVRSVGLYHDSVTVRVFLMETLIGILIYWHYFLRKSEKIKKVFLITLFFSSLLGLYFLYSKAITITLLLWVLLFTFLKGKIYLLPLVLVIALFVNQITDNRIYNDIYSTFSKETDFVRGDLDADYVLKGRGKLWRVSFKNWLNFPVIYKAIGTGIPHEAVHSDYLRVLISGGILLFSSYFILTMTLILNVIYNSQKKRNFIHFVALLCIVYLFSESIGGWSGLYQDIQVITWGIVGLSFNPNLNWNEDIIHT